MQVLGEGVAADSAEEIQAGSDGMSANNQRVAEDEQPSLIVVQSSNTHEKAPGRGPVGSSSRQCDALMTMVANERALCERELSSATRSS